METQQFDKNYQILIFFSSTFSLNYKIAYICFLKKSTFRKGPNGPVTDFISNIPTPGLGKTFTYHNIINNANIERKMFKRKIAFNSDSIFTTPIGYQIWHQYVAVNPLLEFTCIVAHIDNYLQIMPTTEINANHANHANLSAD